MQTHTCGLAVRKCPTADDAPQPKSGSRTGPERGCRGVPTDLTVACRAMLPKSFAWLGLDPARSEKSERPRAAREESEWKAASALDLQRRLFFGFFWAQTSTFRRRNDTHAHTRGSPRFAPSQPAKSLAFLTLPHPYTTHTIHSTRLSLASSCRMEHTEMWATCSVVKRESCFLLLLPPHMLTRCFRGLTDNTMRR